MESRTSDLQQFNCVAQSVHPRQLLELIDNIEGVFIDLEWGNYPKDVVCVQVATPFSVGFNTACRTYGLPVESKRTLDYYSKKIMQTVNKLGFKGKWKNLTDLFRDSLALDGGLFYYTSFGFSVVCYAMSGTRFADIVNAFRDVLDKGGIVYTNEYSDAFLVYRFRFSQKKENIDRIEKFLDNIKETA